MSFTPDEVALSAGAARAILAPSLGGRVLRAQLLAPGAAAVEILHPCRPEGAGLLPWPKGGIYPLIPYSGRIASASCTTRSGMSRSRPVAADALAASEITLFRSEWEGELWLHHRGGGALRLVSGQGLRHLVVHRPAGAPYVCIEPVSHVADGFNLHRRGIAGTGTRILQPGQSMHGRTSILHTIEFAPTI
jgi:galactose mutarotase-like enzyme